MAGKIQVSSMSTRQKITAGVFAVIILILLWQIYKMFGGSNESPPKPVTTAKPVAPKAPGGPTVPQAPAPGTPQQAQLITPAPVPLTPQEQALLKIQQETQAKYLTAVSELQMLKVARDIAETNQAIMTARLSTVTSQKKIVDMLTPQPPPQTAPPPTTQVVPITTIPQQTTLLMGRERNEEVQYVVVSVAQIQYRWSAVLGAKGVLYNVHVGDVLPLDNSRVINIDRSGVIIQRRGVRKRLSLVPII